MKFVETPIAGAFLVEIERATDERGFFARTWSADDFRAHGLNPALSQCSISVSPVQGTVRGMHYQEAPHGECKLVRCTRGSIFDVIADVRREGPSFRRWFGVELTAESRRALYIPEGVAHGFQTLTSDVEVFYQISSPYRPEAARGFRWDDPAFAIRWPGPAKVISDRDRTYPDLHL